MSEAEQQKKSYPHNIDHDEVLDFIKKYSYRGMNKQVAEQVSRSREIKYDSAIQLVNKVKSGQSKNPEVLQLLVEKAKSVYDPIKKIKQLI